MIFHDQGRRKFVFVIPFCLTTALIVLNLELIQALQVKLRNQNILSWHAGYTSDSKYTIKGKISNCPNETYATGFQLKIQENDHDNTGLNGIRLFCAKPGSPDDVVATIESLVGPRGSWRDKHDCEGLLIGFQVKAVFHRINEDAIGAVGMEVFCGNPAKPRIEGEQLQSRYSELRGGPLNCLKRQAICGIQTYLGGTFTKKSFGNVIEDHQGLLRVEMLCCNFEVETQLCRPNDSWKTLIACDNSLNTEGASSLACTYILETGVEMGTKQSSSNYVMAAQKESVGISAGFEYAGLGANFEANLGLSKATGQEWSQLSSDTFTEETRIEVTFSVEPGVKSSLEQVVGTCDSFSVRPNVLRRTNTKKGKKGMRRKKGLWLSFRNYTLDAVRDVARYKELQMSNAK